MEVVASLSQGRTAATQCGLFTHKSVPVIFEPPCTSHLGCGTMSLGEYLPTFRRIALTSFPRSDKQERIGPDSSLSFVS